MPSRISSIEITVPPSVTSVRVMAKLLPSAAFSTSTCPVNVFGSRITPRFAERGRKRTLDSFSSAISMGMNTSFPDRVTRNTPVSITLFWAGLKCSLRLNSSFAERPPSDFSTTRHRTTLEGDSNAKASMLSPFKLPISRKTLFPVRWNSAVSKSGPPPSTFIEGFTEFLPVSSTGHLIIAGQLIGFTGEKAKVFEMVIQSGAMMAVVWEYRERFTRLATRLFVDAVARRFAVNLAVAFLPAAVLGLAFGSAIKQHLFHAVPVAAAFIVGGIIILWVERSSRRPRVDDVDAMTWRDALKVGLAQAFALIPGTSRSGATITGGMLRNLRRPAAARFSFLLMIPIMIAAGSMATLDLLELPNLETVLPAFIPGFLASAVVGYLSIRWLLGYLARRPLFGLRAVVISTILIGLLGFTTWVHHMFVSGMDPRLAMPFSLTTILISVPFAYIVFAMMAAIMFVSLVLLRSIDVAAFRRQAEENISLVERAALASDAG